MSILNFLFMQPQPDGRGGAFSSIIMFAIIVGIIYLFVRLGKKKKSPQVKKVKRPVSNDNKEENNNA